ncbi:hypothetical protein [Arthrobacter woluwensis]|uniref:hypothetical protein n=1 Tax=Arthrobacter woluwensis TaxID=156980 RepID=UPI003821AB10
MALNPAQRLQAVSEMKRTQELLRLTIDSADERIYQGAPDTAELLNLVKAAGPAERALDLACRLSTNFSGRHATLEEVMEFSSASNFEVKEACDTVEFLVSSGLLEISGGSDES